MNMKAQLSKFLVLTLATLTSLGIQATDVTSTFATGDTLTATQMTEVKDAVNSKQNIVSGTCPSGQSIRVINLDGTVTCQAAATRSIITIITTSADIGSNSFGCIASTCPVSHPIAIGGGVDPNNVFSMRITGSNPVISGETRISVLADGQHPAPTGWSACAVNNAGFPQSFATVAICSDE